MNIAILLAGLVLLVMVLADFAYTTVSANMTGPLTRRVAAGVWQVHSLLARISGGRWVRRAAGPLVMSGVAMFWIAGTSLAWLLVFQSDPQAVLNKQTDTPAGWAQSYAFVGSALSTVGASNARAGTTVWDIVAMAAAVNGMVVLTLSVTFVLNVTQTVTTGRGVVMLADLVDPADTGNRSTLLPELTTLCMRLNGAPLALYYSTDREELSVPDGLLRLARRAARTPEVFEDYRHILKELPHFDAPEDLSSGAFLEKLAAWRDRFSPHGTGDEAHGKGR
ncbi:hypothetical protein [Oricola cellulosilytica]|uniref:Two pore domain potassium channel family protein n=1 Tax=Oricola cellulosilytica TaxID=1429082 RepID=A0A4V2MNZ7_9HYPH|nr:hypothetical protein [Oricola cellulosilytica]TCD15307.1 hypothetical protein E0D97_07160 [Oricola cellulosilytica]